MLKTFDNTQYKRLSGRIGDRQPALGGRKQRALYTATGGETSIDLSLLTPSLSYTPSANQISVKRTSGSGLIAGIDFYERTATSIGFPTTDPLLAGEIVEIILDFGITSVMAVAPRADCFSQTATAGQTLITADFSWTYNLNPSKAIGGVRFEINGITQTRGIDFTEVNLGNVNTNQIVVNDAFLGGENIILTPVYQAIDTSAASTSFYGQAYSNMQSAFTAGTQAFIDQSSDMISVPNTTIVNRAKIPNLANDLRASLGNERIPVQSIMQLQNEFGANGEPVFAALNDDRGLIRFVGSSSSSVSTNGAMVRLSTGGYLEITFFGTGLNLLSYADGYAYTAYATVDGATESVINIYPVTSNILASRGYGENCIFPVSTTSLGVHTVKIRNSSGADILIFGFEIINANASGLININPGVGYINGQKYTNTLVDSVAYNAGVTGTKGGRLVRYINSDGTFGQAFQATDASTLYIANAVHTNEEVARVFHWREFGAGRTDDFSLLKQTDGNQAKAFTLDDGTTSLVASNMYCRDATQSLTAGSIGSTYYVILTFIGTGIDLVKSDEGSAGTTTLTITIDGNSITGSPYSYSPTATPAMLKIASGLPYGTHTLKIVNTTASNSFGVQKFIVYQPKKPSVPSSSIEICDYNVMADLVANSTAGIETISQGVLRKEISQREAVYVGAGWATPALYVTTAVGGWQTYTGTTTQYVEYTFFGTGFEARSYSQGSSTWTVQVDGAFPSAVAYYGGFNSYTSGTGALTANASTAGSGFRVVGLALGIHKVRVTLTAGTYIYTEALDIITPIHSYKSNLYADFQNTLTVGSNSLMDSRKTSMIKEALPAQKAWAQAVGITSDPTITSVSYVPLTDMSVTIKTSGGPLKIDSAVTCYNSVAGKFVYINVYVDGVSQASNLGGGSGSVVGTISNSIIVPVAAGIHKVDLYWATDTGGTCYAAQTRRYLTAQEI